MEKWGWFSEDIQEEALDLLFDPPDREQILDLLRSKASEVPPWILINDWQLKLLVKAALLYGSTNRNLSLEDPQRRRSFARSFLIANDLRVIDRPPSGYTNRKDLREGVQETLVREGASGQQQEFLYLLARHYDLFLRLPQDPELAASPDHMDVCDEFLKATGVGLQVFMAVGFSVLSHYLAAESFAPFDFMIKKSRYFRESAVSRAERDACFDLLSTNREQHRRVHRSKYPRGLGYLFDFIHLQRRPLIRIRPGWYTPTSPLDLVQRVSSGIYWDIHDYSKGKRRKRFQRFYGQLLELYVQRAFQRTLPSSKGLVQRLFRDVTYHVGGQERRSSDVIVLGEKGAIFLDVTVGRLRMAETIVTGSLASFRDDLQKKLVAKAAQIDRVIRDFKAEHLILESWNPTAVTRYYPVVVVDSPLPLMLQTYEELLDMVKSNGALQGNDIEQLMVLSVEDIERMEGIVGAGRGWLDLIRGKANNSSMRLMPMKSYLDTLPVSLRQHNTYLSDLFGTEAEKIPKMLFPALTA